MNRLNELIYNNSFEKDKLYLLKKINDDFGFFYQNDNVYFGKKANEFSDKSLTLETSCLNFYAKLSIKAITSNASFEEGEYDLLMFKNVEDISLFDVFYEMCLTYIASSEQISFYEFFNNLSTMFDEKNDIFENIEGLVGELILAKEMYEKYNLNIMKYWHTNGSTSKFDFSFPNYNVEVKTTIKTEPIFTIKHDQIFNNQNNYVAIVNIIENGNGIDVITLINYFLNDNEFKNDFNVTKKLFAELLRLNNNKNKDKKFNLVEINFVDINDMNQIKDIPSNISKMVYSYDFSDTKKKSFDDGEFIKTVFSL